MSTTKKTAKANLEDIQSVMQNLIAQGKKEGMLRASDRKSVV